MNHIVGYPRSGATQFAIDYAKKHGFIWRGELNTKMISTNGNHSQIKRDHHEAGWQPDGTPCQPEYPTEDSYFNALNDEQSLWLINDHHNVGKWLPYSKAIIMRKNYMHSFYSLNRVFDLHRHYETPDQLPWWVNDWTPFVRNLSITVSWLLEQQAPVVWYEEYFPDANIERYDGEDRVLRDLPEILLHYDIENKMKELVNRG